MPLANRVTICIIVAALPPQLDGIGDYTARLAAELSRTSTVSVLTGKTRDPAPIPDVEVVPCFSPEKPGSVAEIVPFVRERKTDWLLLQYNPFSFGRWGLNLHLPRAVAAALRSSPGTRLALMVHEPFVPLTSWKFVIMSVWQRWQLWRLGHAASAVFFSIDPWVGRFRSWFGRRPVVHLPVGSNMPRVAISRGEARERLRLQEETLVLGLFGSLNATRMPGLIRQTVEQLRRKGREVTLLYIGPDVAVARAEFPGLCLIANGAASPEEVSRRFAAMDVCLAPYIDGISTRRTTLMTALQHGIPTVGTHGALTDELLLQSNGQAFLLADVRVPDEFSQAVLKVAGERELRDRLGAGAHALFERMFTWERIAGHLLQSLNREEHP